MDTISSNTPDLEKLARETRSEIYRLFGSQGYVDSPDYLRIILAALQRAVAEKAQLIQLQGEHLRDSSETIVDLATQLAAAREVLEQVRTYVGSKYQPVTGWIDDYFSKQ